MTGTLMGCLGIFITGAGTPIEGSWYIPIAIQPVQHVQHLQDQAIMLRVLHVVLKDGLTYLLVPILMCIGLTRLWQYMVPPGTRGLWPRWTWFYLASCGLVILVAGLLHLNANAFSESVLTFGESVFALGGWLVSSFLAIVGLTVIGALPVMSAICALFINAHSRIQDDARSTGLQPQSKPSGVGEASSLSIGGDQDCYISIPLPEDVQEKRV